MLQDSEDSEDSERVAALDIGKAELVACVRVPNPDKPGRRAQEITTYSMMTRSLLGLADRLRGLSVTRVVMEATSDYVETGVLHQHGPEGCDRRPDGVRHPCRWAASKPCTGSTC